MKQMKMMTIYPTFKYVTTRQLISDCQKTTSCTEMNVTVYKNIQDYAFTTLTFYVFKDLY